ncbi:hypothetical protein WR25_07026 [Diploscapter pachys]|uniref:ShKT domain-containing protein n=1 Tax=Diploscapter pachys TaxID=2018661 RepID=A0A2A2JS93_9BILA|nr:hypothetical protein WR25_07026 [Diploscapter pachys]
MMNFVILLWLFKCSNACLTTPDMDLPPVQPTTYAVMTATTTCVTPGCTSSTMTSSSSTSTTTTSTTTTTTTTIDCFANSAPLAECAAQCPAGWDFVSGKCYQFFATAVSWNTAAANCMILCAMCHLPRVYSLQQGKDLRAYERVPSTILEIWIGTVGMTRVEAVNVKAWSRFSYGNRNESRTFARISTSHDQS